MVPSPTTFPSTARRLASIFALLVIITTLAGLPPATQAAPSSAPGEITVNTTTDEYGNGTDCSLREAIQAANDDANFGGCPAGNGTDVIILASATYTLTRAGHSEDGNATGDLDIAGNLTLSGVVSSTTVIDAAQIDRVLHAQSGSVVLRDLTITGGQTPHGSDGADAVSAGDDGQDGGSGQDGGGVLNEGTLDLQRVIVRDNRTGNGGRGGDGVAGAPSTGPGIAGQDGGEGGNGGGAGNPEASTTAATAWCSTR